jgi:hypothetical protein
MTNTTTKETVFMFPDCASKYIRGAEQEKYIAIIDLPAMESVMDAICRPCKSACKVTRTTVGTYFDGNEWHTICPTDCPLIHVDRVRNG